MFEILNITHLHICRLNVLFFCLFVCLFCFFPQDAEIIRTRDPAQLAECDVVVDVGGEFDPKKHRYDHHQRYHLSHCDVIRLFCNNIVLISIFHNINITYDTFFLQNCCIESYSKYCMLHLTWNDFVVRSQLPK